MTRRRYIQDRETNELIEVPINTLPATRGLHMIVKSFEPFISPIDKTLISDPSDLREHNRKHGVTNIHDYSPETQLKNRRDRDDRMHGRTKEQKTERIENIKRAFYIDEHRR